jgi:hypothetical protein
LALFSYDKLSKAEPEKGWFQPLGSSLGKPIKSPDAQSRTALKQTQISHAGSLPPLGGTSGPRSGAETQRRPRGRAAPGTISARPPGPEVLLSHCMRKWPWQPSKVPADSNALRQADRCCAEALQAHDAAPAPGGICGSKAWQGAAEALAGCGLGRAHLAG